uniref:Uncharacterized protein n=1 Tax=Ciona intestinalis TaxID=7719 RepID=H2XUX0_CIOIN
MCAWTRQLLQPGNPVLVVEIVRHTRKETNKKQSAYKVHGNSLAPVL